MRNETRSYSRSPGKDIENLEEELYERTELNSVNQYMLMARHKQLEHDSEDPSPH